MKRDKHKPRQHWSCLFGCAVLALVVAPSLALADDDDSGASSSSSGFAITSATWDSGDDELTVRGTGDRYRSVTVVNAYNDERIGTASVGYRQTWLERQELDGSVPCRVRATQSDGQEDEMDVANAPSDCAPRGDGGGSEPEPPAPVVPDISINDVTVNEASGSAVFTVSLSAPTSQTVSVSYATADGSAQVGRRDYYSASGTLTFAPGDIAETISVTIRSSSWTEQTETFEVRLSNASNANIADGTGVGTIIDGNGTIPDDGGVPTPTPNQAPTANAGPNQTVTLAQGQSTVNVTLNGSGSSDSDGTVASYNWTGNPDPVNTVSPSVSLSAGNYTFTLVVTDNAGAMSAADTVNITVNAAPQQNQAPTANAGPDQTRTLSQGQSSMNVTLNGSGSSDNDGTVTTYNWTGTPNPSNTVSPTVSLAAGQYTFTLVVTDNDGATSAPDTVNITVNAAPQQNQVPIANAGPDQTLTLTQGQSTMVVALNGSGSSDPDGTVQVYTWTGSPNPGDVAQPTMILGPGSYTFTLVVQDNDGATSAPDTVSVTVEDAAAPPPPVACVETPGNGPQTHADCITDYTGPEVCVSCHESQARAMHASVHYQQNGPTDYVTNINGLAGERGLNVGETGINTYCGTHDNSPRFTCAGCHVGNGRFPVSTAEFSAMSDAQQLNELANVDCLTCHQEVYKRFPDPTAGFENLVLENVSQGSNGALVRAQGQSVTRTGLAGIPIVDSVTADFDFVPADPDNPELLDITAALMSVSALEAAQTVHPTTRRSCLNCHGGAGGGDGTKRGDMSSALVSPSLAIDQHMSPQGRNMTCSECHSAGNHRVRGRGVDLRVNDVPERFTCENGGCHNASTVHNNVTNGSTFARHVAKVACQTCHIPTYAKGVATEVSRDWQDPHVSQTACNGRGGWLPREDKGGDLEPSYAWFDGNSEVYVLGENLSGVPTVPLPSAMSSLFRPSAGSSQGNFDTNDPAYVLGLPTAILSGGNINMTVGASNSSAKLYPMKEHWGKLARNTRTNTLIGHSTFEFFRTGDFDLAVRSGLTQTEGMNATDGYTVVPVHTYQSINHGVETANNALGANGQCGNCHNVNGQSGGPARLDLKGELGYRVSSNINWSVNSSGTSTCSPSCHGRASASFTSLHSRSQHVSRGCRSCHDQITGR